MLGVQVQRWLLDLRKGLEVGGFGGRVGSGKGKDWLYCPRTFPLSFLIFPIEPLAKGKGLSSAFPCSCSKERRELKEGSLPQGKAFAEFESQLGAAPSLGHCCYCLHQLQNWLGAQDALISLLFTLSARRQDSFCFLLATSPEV